MSAFIGNDRANLDGVLIARNWRLSSNDWEKPESPIPGKCLWNKEIFSDSLPNEGIFNFKEIVEFNKGKDLEKKFTCISRGTENSRHILEQNESW